MTQPDKLLLYFADPMCSWCWGFAPVIARVRKEYSARIVFSLNLGGLRPGTTEPVTEAFRDEILHHWQDVNNMTGQPFRFEGAMPEGFIYDTEPASRAVLAFGRINPAKVLDYFVAIQSAFYAEGRNVTDVEVLSDVAANFDVERDRFIELFESDELKAMTRQHFQRARQAGVRGFPTVVMQQGEHVDLVCAGYAPYEQVIETIDSQLAALVSDA